MNRWNGKVAVVTGASGGIGAAIARKLVENGLHVIGFARRKNLLDDLERSFHGMPGKFCGMAVDMSKENDIVDALKSVEKNYGCVHVLINNAAIFEPGSYLLSGETDKWRNVLDVNVLGVCIATRESVRMMKKYKVDGHVVNVNSILGNKIVPIFQDLGLYAASKHAVKLLSEQLRYELIDDLSKVKVTNLSPGGVDTALLTTLRTNNDIYDSVPEEAVPKLQPEDVAYAVCYVLSLPPRVNITQLTIQSTYEKL